MSFNIINLINYQREPYLSQSIQIIFYLVSSNFRFVAKITSPTSDLKRKRQTLHWLPVIEFRTSSLLRIHSIFTFLLRIEIKKAFLSE